jgi:oligopeptide/dipeptide ABC transporter ATP-binding protein
MTPHPQYHHGGTGTREHRVTTVVEASALKKYFPLSSTVMSVVRRRSATRTIRAVDGVEVRIHHQEIFALVGESGCGKSTLGMTLVRLYEPSEGRISVHGEDVTRIAGSALRSFRRRAQIIFQDPYASLNPRLTVGQSLEEPLEIHRLGDQNERMLRVVQAAERVNMSPSQFLRRYPHELSGGQRQRLVIARALVLEPAFLVADEPVSMLDVSVRAGILDLLQSLSEEFGLSILYVSHDIATVRYICHRVAVMYLGVFVEVGETNEVIDHPAHPYTRSLMAAVPVVDPSTPRQRVELPGEVPSPTNIPCGCRFRTRCPRAMEICGAVEPTWKQVGRDHQVACHLY